MDPTDTAYLFTTSRDRDQPVWCVPGGGGGPTVSLATHSTPGGLTESRMAFTSCNSIFDVSAGTGRARHCAHASPMAAAGNRLLPPAMALARLGDGTSSPSASFPSGSAAPEQHGGGALLWPTYGLLPSLLPCPRPMRHATVPAAWHSSGRWPWRSCLLAYYRRF